MVAELCEVFRISPCDAVSLLDKNINWRVLRFSPWAFLSRNWRKTISRGDARWR